MGRSLIPVGFHRGVQVIMPEQIIVDNPFRLKQIHPFDNKLKSEGYTDSEINEVNQFMKANYPEDWPVKPAPIDKVIVSPRYIKGWFI